MLLFEPLQIVGVVLAEKLVFAEFLARGIRTVLRIQESNAHLLRLCTHFRPLPNARRLTQDRQAVKTLWKHSLKVRLQLSRGLFGLQPYNQDRCHSRIQILDTVSPLMFAQLLKCCVHQRLADQFIFGKNMITWREGLER